MEIIPHNYKNIYMNKLPFMPMSSNPHDNYNYKRTNSKKISEKNNIKKIGDSFQQKTKYKINFCPLVSSTLEVNKNNSYQIQNLTNERNNEREKLIVNKVNIRLKNKLDKNMSFVSKNEKREASFNKKDIIPNLLNHISLKNSSALLDSNKRIDKNFGIKPNYLQYNFEQIKLINKKNFMNLIKDINKDNNCKENDKNYMIKEKYKNNSIKGINFQKAKNKGILNDNSNNLYLKLNNNYKNNNNRHNIHINRIENDNKAEYFDEKNEKEIELTKEEKLIYGNRTMKNYYKIKLLGKGGCGIVWLCHKKINNEKLDTELYAVKQISKKTCNTNSLLCLNLEENIKIARNEIKILKRLNDSKNNCEIIPKLYDFYEDNNDIWFAYEKGGYSLSSLSFKIKGEFEKGERIYNIQKGIFIKYLLSNIMQFKLFIKKILLGIEFINEQNVIHSDIKPENILIEYSNTNNIFEIKKIKIIDYGSSFNYLNIANITSNTPEYLCPEITIGNKNFLKNLTESKKYINCIDIWSFGITLLELCLCCPIWMSYKSKIFINGKNYYTIGYFGCKGRDGNKIYQKQIELSKNINKILKNSLLYMLEKNEKEKFVDLLGKMLEFNYNKRINIKDAINHPFLIFN